VPNGISIPFQVTGITAANWTPDGVPNGPADIATFGLSNTTVVSISEDTEVSGIIFTPAATNPYFIIVNSDITLTLSGTGITNNSGIAQNFFLSSGDFSGGMRFTHSATAADARIGMGSATIITFLNRSSAGSSTISSAEVDTSVNFFNSSTAANTHMDFTGGVFNAVTFHDHSTAGSATLELGENGSVSFFDHSSAGNATIITLGNPFRAVEFFDSSTAGNATIQGNGGRIVFDGLSRGGTAAIGLFFDFGFDFPSSLDISGHDAPGVTIGSLEGDETATVSLGGNDLTIGSNNLSTTFAGVIQDSGSVTKIGTGTLTLTGANTYTGDTNVNRGVLQVDGSITSNTFVNNRGTLAGTGTINGNVVNNSRVSPGSAGAPGMLTVTGNYTQAQFASLMIQIAGVSAGEFSVLNVLGSANLNGFLDPVLLNGFVPTLGDSFVFLNYESLTGQFAHIRHRFLGDGLQWSVIYEANHAILTVEQHVPDQGSTLLLLALGLVSLVTYRRKLLRAQTRAS
jgi:autotransporter-associated beta strand protein